MCVCVCVCVFQSVCLSVFLPFSVLSGGEDEEEEEEEAAVSLIDALPRIKPPKLRRNGDVAFKWAVRMLVHLVFARRIFRRNA